MIRNKSSNQSVTESRYHSKTPPTTNNSNFKCPHYGQHLFHGIYVWHICSFFFAFLCFLYLMVKLKDIIYENLFLLKQHEFEFARKQAHISNKHQN